MDSLLAICWLPCPLESIRSVWSHRFYCCWDRPLSILSSILLSAFHELTSFHCRPNSILPHCLHTGVQRTLEFGWALVARKCDKSHAQAARALRSDPNSMCNSWCHSPNWWWCVWGSMGPRDFLWCRSPTFLASIAKSRRPMFSNAFFYRTKFPMHRSNRGQRTSQWSIRLYNSTDICHSVELPRIACQGFGFAKIDLGDESPLGATIECPIYICQIDAHQSAHHWNWMILCRQSK